MSNEESTIETLRNLYTAIKVLRTIDTVETMIPDSRERWDRAMNEAYTALAIVETELDMLAQELRAHQDREVVEL
jgi:hypothetical protein